MSTRARVAILIALCCIASQALAGNTKHRDHWYDWFWPLGERVSVEALKDEYVPFQAAGEIPDRPQLHIELGDGFLDTGKLDSGFEIPVLGAVWQPRLWNYIINRSVFIDISIKLLS